MTFAFKHLPTTSQADVTTDLEQLLAGIPEELLAAAVQAKLLGSERVTEAMLVKALQERVTQDSGWLAPTFEHSWKNTGGEFLTAAYRKQGNVVRLRGTIQGGAENTVAFTLPAGYRPTAKTFQACAGTEGTVEEALEVAANGEVLIVNKGLAGLDGVTFTVD